MRGDGWIRLIITASLTWLVAFLRSCSSRVRGGRHIKPPPGRHGGSRDLITTPCWLIHDSKIRTRAILPWRKIRRLWRWDFVIFLPTKSDCCRIFRTCGSDYCHIAAILFRAYKESPIFLTILQLLPKFSCRTCYRLPIFLIGPPHRCSCLVLPTQIVDRQFFVLVVLSMHKPLDVEYALVCRFARRGKRILLYSGLLLQFLQSYFVLC